MDYKVGVIDRILTECKNGSLKRTVELRIDKKQLAFFEFQGRYAEKLRDLKQGDSVKLYFEFNGKTSKRGVSFNNLIGKNIFKIP